MPTLLWSFGPLRLELWYGDVLVLIEGDSTVVRVVHLRRATPRGCIEVQGWPAETPAAAG